MEGIEPEKLGKKGGKTREKVVYLKNIFLFKEYLFYLKENKISFYLR